MHIKHGDAPGPQVPALSAALLPAPLSRPAGLGQAMQRPRALVCGGSIAGLCTAAALHSIGCQVEVLERGSLSGVVGGGIVAQPDLVAFLREFTSVDTARVLVQSQGRQFLDQAGRLVRTEPSRQSFTAWDTLWRALRAALPPGVPYHAGVEVANVQEQQQQGSEAAVGPPLLVISSCGRRWEVDLLVGADGPGSYVRGRLLPGVQSAYAGYIAWRGWLLEGDAPPALRDAVDGRFTVVQVPRSHILVYPIPGPGGELEPGRRRLNWVWYVNYEDADLDRVLVDKTGKRKRYSMPHGELSPTVEREVRELAAQTLPEPYAGMVAATPHVFAQAIHDLAAHTVSDGRGSCLVGDAAFIVRPHTAAGTTKAALNAWQLASALQRHAGDVPAALAEYEREALATGLNLTELGKRIGDSSQYPERRGGAS